MEREHLGKIPGREKRKGMERKGRYNRKIFNKKCKMSLSVEVRHNAVTITIKKVALSFLKHSLTFITVNT